MIKLMITKSV